MSLPQEKHIFDRNSYQTCSQERGVHSKHCSISQNLGEFLEVGGIQKIFFSGKPSTCYSGLQEAFKDLEIRQVSMLLKGSIPVR